MHNKWYTTWLEISILVYNYVCVVGSNHRISSFYSEWCGYSVKSMNYMGSHKEDIFHALICHYFENCLKKRFLAWQTVKAEFWTRQFNESCYFLSNATYKKPTKKNFFHTISWKFFTTTCHWHNFITCC